MSRRECFMLILIPRTTPLVWFLFPARFFSLAQDRFCSLSWYERQLVENSRGRESKRVISSKIEKEDRDKLSEGRSGVVDDIGVEGGGSDGTSPPGWLRNSDADFGTRFSSRERLGEASVMATLKVNKRLLLWLTFSIPFVLLNINKLSTVLGLARRGRLMCVGTAALQRCRTYLV